MSTHDGLVLLAIYVGVIGAGALIEYVEHRVKRAIRRRKRSWKTSLFFIKTLDKYKSKCYTINTVKERGTQKMKYRVYTEDNYSARLGYYLPTYFKTKKEAQAYAKTLTKPATIERKLVNTWVKC